MVMVKRMMMMMTMTVYGVTFSFGSASTTTLRTEQYFVMTVYVEILLRILQIL
jgi:hypothetical protein